MISFGVKYWYFFLPIIIMAASIIMLLMYYRNNASRELTNKQRILLMSLRFLTIAATAFLLLSPFIQTLKRTVQNPLIIAAWDNSESMISTSDSAKASAEIIKLKEKVSEELGNDYQLLNYSFGEEAKSDQTLDFSDRKSDYGNLLATLANNHYNEKIGALIITGDGIINQGRNPLNMINDFNIPVYTIGLGDTTEITDARIQDIRVNRTSFSGNRFPVEVDAVFTKLKGTPLKISITDNEKEVSHTIVSPGNDDYFITHQFILEAGEPGLKHYTVEIEAAENEQNLRNNKAIFIVNVLENKQKILVLSNGPHPDIGAIANTLKEQKSYEVSIFHEEPYPSDFSEFNLIILHQLPASGRSLTGIVNSNGKSRIPLLFIHGAKTFIPQFNSLSAGAEIQPLAGSPEDAQAFVNPAYGTFSLSEQFREMVNKFPPLKVPFANYALDPVFTPVLFQKIKNIDTNKPLLATGIINGRKTGFLFGEGIWQWRLNNYFQTQSHDQFNEIITQLVQYLALKENEDNFMIDYEPVYAETDDVIFTAEVYNDAYEKITAQEVTMKINNEQGEAFEFTFDVRGNDYFLNAGNLPVGNYSFHAGVVIGGVTYTETGNFVVTEMNLERVVLKANHRMLYQLASQSGGSFSNLNEVDEMIATLKESNHLKPVSSFQELITELLNQRWLFFVLILLMGMEWFLRKYWGIY